MYRFISLEIISNFTAFYSKNVVDRKHFLSFFVVCKNVFCVFVNEKNRKKMEELVDIFYRELSTPIFHGLSSLKPNFHCMTS
jgi:hypothetical protein